MAGRLGRLAPALLAATAWACAAPGDPPVLESIEPSLVFDDQQVELQLRGRFEPRVKADFDAPSRSEIETFDVELFTAAQTRALGQARLVDSQTLTVTLPAGTAPGAWGVRIRDGWGRQASLESALAVEPRDPTCCSDAGVSVRAPPRASIVTASTLVREGAEVEFDASRARDETTPSAELEVGWLFSPGGAWTDWSGDPVTTAIAPAAGEWTVAVRVRDGDGDVAYGELRLLVAGASEALCRVTTGGTVRDGATACDAPGTDGKLSLDEAVEILKAQPGPANVLIAQGVALSGASLALPAQEIRLGVERGVKLRRELVIPAGTTLRLSGLEVVKPPGPGRLKVEGGVLDLSDTRLQGSTPLRVAGGSAVARRCLFDCGSCVQVDGADATARIHDSQMVGDRAGVAVDAVSCRSGAGFGIDLATTSFSRFGTAVRIGAACTSPTSLVHLTFDDNGTAVSYAAGGPQMHLLFNSAFTRHSGDAVAGCGASFVARGGNLVHKNQSDACLIQDEDVRVADPLFVAPDAELPEQVDVRPSFGSPAIDAAGTLMDVNGAAPGLFLGLAADIGARETY